MRKRIFAIGFIIVFAVVYLIITGATKTPTAMEYEVKIYTEAIITTSTKSGDLPKPVATYLPCLTFQYSGTGVTITGEVDGNIAKIVQTQAPNYNVTVVSVNAVPTATVTRIP